MVYVSHLIELLGLALVFTYSLPRVIFQEVVVKGCHHREDYFASLLLQLTLQPAWRKTAHGIPNASKLRP